jgi:membrane carboxypeptidase/penicillin-binding protein PbpC
MLENIQLFLANSPFGGALKAASGAVLVWLLDNVATLDIPAIAQVAIIAALPVFINYLNPADTRYGSESE